MYNLILLNKPFNVLSQFTDDNGRQTLADYVQDSGFYAAGRLDYDSEGLLVLTSSGPLQNRIASPKHKLAKTYWVQVEGDITDYALNSLAKGVSLKDGVTKPATAKKIQEPKHLWKREPPIRERKNIPTSWIALTIKEGKNRQVRRMTAAVGFPTLRLIRYSVGDWTIDDLLPGEIRTLTVAEPLPSKKINHYQKPPKNRRFNKSRGKPRTKGANTSSKA
jgi:23S rRNA pseudouridine2457 synthase